MTKHSKLVLSKSKAMESYAHAVGADIPANLFAAAGAKFNHMMLSRDGGYIRNVIENASVEELTGALALSDEKKPQENGIDKYAEFFIPESGALGTVKDGVLKAEQALKDAWVHVFNQEYYVDGKNYDYEAFLTKMRDVVTKKEIEGAVRAELGFPMGDD